MTYIVRFTIAGIRLAMPGPWTENYWKVFPYCSAYGHYHDNDNVFTVKGN